MRQIAAKRSGARGAKAKKELIKTEEEFEVSLARCVQSRGNGNNNTDSTFRLDADLTELDATALSNETQAAVELLNEVQSNLELVLRTPSSTPPHADKGT